MSRLPCSADRRVNAELRTFIIRNSAVAEVADLGTGVSYPRLQKNLHVFALICG